MAEIYTNAEQVLIWLGIEAPEDKGALEVLPEWLQVTGRMSNINWRAAGIKWISPTQFTFNEKQVSDDTATLLRYQQQHLVQIMHLFSRPWWVRKWVIQESVKAKDAILICGRSSIKWKQIEQPLAALITRNWKANSEFKANLAEHHPKQDLIHGFGTGLSSASIMVSLAVVTARRGGPLLAKDLWSIASMTSRSLCGDPRDHLFALLGLIDTAQAPGGSDLLRVDYSDTVAQVSARFCQWLIENHSAPLQHFGEVPGSRGCSNPLPSWARSLEPVPNAVGKDLDSSVCKLSYDAGCASKRGLRPVLGFSGDNRILRLEAYVLDKVVEIVQPPELTWNGFRWTMRVDDIARWGHTCYRFVVNRSSLRYLFRVFICGGNEAHKNDSSWDQVSEEAFQIYMDGLIDYDIQKSTDYPAEKYPETIPVHKAMLETMTRKLCATSDGRVGWLESISEVGDTICIVLGANTPYVISDCGNGHYNFIGHCYIDGLMHGEVLDLDTSPMQIELC